jgi:hypothetical protein
LATGYNGDGGGAYGSALYNCALTGNSAGGYFGSWGYGGGAIRGTLINCTLTGNSAGGAGGGAYQADMSRCTLGANTAWAGGGADSSMLNECRLISNFAYAHGGGANGGTLVNCVVMSNSVSGYNGNPGLGGGIYIATLINCTVVGNSAGYGGGTYYSELTNCIVYYNIGANGANWNGDLFINCATTPQPAGSGNITSAPLFVDQAGGNLRLQSNSPCIDAGNNASAAGSTDLDGHPRIQDGVGDIGAYEFQAGVSGVFIGWLQQYGLPTDGSADYSDSDNDRLNNWQEWIAGTVPTDASSALRLLNPSNDVSGIVVTWQSVTNRTYFLERTTNLAAATPFSLLTSNLVGQAGTTSYTDTNAVGPGPFFYRVGVQP